MSDPFEGLTASIEEQAKNLKQIFDALRQALTVAETGINERTSKILTRLEPITKMLEVNQTIARELGANINEAIKMFAAQQNEIEKLADKIMPQS